MNKLPLRWGPFQLLNPTPDFARKIFKGFFFATATASVAIKIFTQIPPGISHQIDTYVLEGNAFVGFLCQMWGIDINAVQPPSK